MKKFVLTQEQLDQIIRAAFQEGECWGVCYQGWFTPSADDTEDRIQKCKSEIMTTVKES